MIFSKEKRIVLQAVLENGTTKTALVTEAAYFDSEKDPAAFFVGPTSAKVVGEVYISGSLAGSYLDEVYISD